MTFFRLSSLFLVLPCLLTTPVVLGQEEVQIISSTELYAGIEVGHFNIWVDVRSSEEYNSGHLANATLSADLSLDGVAPSSEIMECIEAGCLMVLTCRTGGRAGVAANRLVEEYGVDPDRLRNGQGISQWTSAGYPLVADDLSRDPGCRLDEETIDEMMMKNTTMDGMDDDGYCSACCMAAASTAADMDGTAMDVPEETEESMETAEGADTGSMPVPVVQATGDSAASLASFATAVAATIAVCALSA
ncbi:MAG: hypothetical protein SGILL_001842 [Bacillariaceae sp.]